MRTDEQRALAREYYAQASLAQRSARAKYNKEYQRRYYSDPANKEKRKKYASNRRPVMRARELRREYGITPEHYDLMLSNQQGRCAICGTDKPEDSKGRGFHVDHDHLHGEVRGLLCGTCNWGLGHFRDDVDRLEQAVRYLRGKRLIDLIADEARRRAEERPRP